MNSNEIFEVIEQIASTTSKNEKEALIAAHANEANFERVLVAALSPFVTYGIKKLPEPEGEGGRYMTEGEWRLLDALATRELSGNAAQSEVAISLNNLEPNSRELFKRILLKDLRAGFSESTVNKAIPGLIPTFDCMLAHPYKEHKHKLSFPLWVEPKLDGVRVLTFVIGDTVDTVRFFSRSGKEFTTFDHLKEPVLRMVNSWRASTGSSLEFSDYEGGIVLESEVVSGSFNKTVSEVRRKDEQATDAVLYLFDVLPIVTFQSDNKSGCKFAGPWKTRRLLLESIALHRQPGDPLVLNKACEVTSEADIHLLYSEYRAQGLEGVIVKDPKALYHRRRNHGWSKIKAEESVDIPIIGAVEGTGKYEGMLGALIVDFNGIEVNIGSGFRDDQRQEMWDAYQTDIALWDDRDARPDPNAPGLIKGRLICVEFHEVTPDGSLRHPRFKCFRDDKPVTEAA